MDLRMHSCGEQEGKHGYHNVSTDERTHVGVKPMNPQKWNLGLKFNLLITKIEHKRTQFSFEKILNA